MVHILFCRVNYDVNINTRTLALSDAQGLACRNVLGLGYHRNPESFRGQDSIIHYVSWSTRVGCIYHKQNVCPVNSPLIMLTLEAMISILQWRHTSQWHMGVMASQITDDSTVCSTPFSGVLQRKYQSYALLGLCEGNPSGTDGFPSQRASNAENMSTSWRHNVLT